jgi:hypothetical protein
MKPGEEEKLTPNSALESTATPSSQPLPKRRRNRRGCPRSRTRPPESLPPQVQAGTRVAKAVLLREPRPLVEEAAAADWRRRDAEPDSRVHVAGRHERGPLLSMEILLPSSEEVVPVDREKTPPRQRARMVRAMFLRCSDAPPAASLVRPASCVPPDVDAPPLASLASSSSTVQLHRRPRNLQSRSPAPCSTSTSGSFVDPDESMKSRLPHRSDRPTQRSTDLKSPRGRAVH